MYLDLPADVRDNCSISKVMEMTNMEDMVTIALIIELQNKTTSISNNFLHTILKLFILNK